MSPSTLKTKARQAAQGEPRPVTGVGGKAPGEGSRPQSDLGRTGQGTRQGFRGQGGYLSPPDRVGTNLLLAATFPPRD